MAGRWWTAALACVMAIPAQGQAWRHTVEGFPADAVEGQALRFRIAYRARERTKLHAEVKDVTNVVHASDVREVSGEGVADFAIVLPEGRFLGQLLVAYWFGDDWREPRIPVAHVGPVHVYTAQEAALLAASDRDAEGIRKKLGLDPSRPTVAVLTGGWAGRSANLATAYVGAIKRTGLRCIAIGPEAVANRGVLRRDLISMLVVPEARTYPGEGIAALLTFLRGGGHLAALGAPAFDRLVRRVPTPSGHEWVDEVQITERMRNTPATRALLDMATMADGDWRRSANDMAAACSWRMVADADHGRAVEHEIGNLTGWETLEATLARPGAAGDNLVTFRARGGPDTTMLAVEMRERDGSRWIAAVPITAAWKRYALPTTAFRLWDPDNRSGRNRPTDGLRLTEASTVAVGLAFTHVTLPGGKHRYRFADLGSARGPEMIRYTTPTLDTLSPAYKLYPIRGASALDGSQGAVLVGAPVPGLPRDILSTHPRPTGAGFEKRRKYRWVPLLQVRGKQGVAGTAATLVAHTKGEFAGGRWASFTVADTRWYARTDVQRYVAALARRMHRPAMLAEGGAAYFGYFPDENPEVGLRTTQERVSGVTARIEVTDPGGRAGAPRPRVVFARNLIPTAFSGGAIAAARWLPDGLKAPRYRVTVKLTEAGRLVDMLSHEITIRHPSLKRRPWVAVRKGQFSLGGKPWYPHGVNYMPSSGVAAEDGHYFEKWLSEESYDPVVIERDLRRVRAAGFDMVSVFIYTESARNHNLVDLLNRCDANGLRANLSLRPGTPLDFEWPAIGEIITVNRLADDPTVFAYDLAWEPAWGYRDQRRRWDDAWEEWIRRTYGSIEAAEADWGAAVPRENGKVAGPSDADVTATSAIPKVVAAYRRSQDDLLSRKHMEARQKVRTLDTRHLLSFRMSIAGDPTCGPTIMPYDFTGLARSMDFMSPEGYGRIGERDRVRPGWFTAAYSRMVAPDRPVLWAEFGYTLWNRGEAPEPKRGRGFADAFDSRNYLPATIAFTERYYRAFYDMALASGASGTVCWWYPGGFRFGENSDFGIINPDGTWRGLTRIIAQNARRFAARPAVPEPGAWIAVNRDAHADGIYGVYAACKDEFWRLADAGKFPGLRLEWEGEDSATTPMVAVGGGPCTGANPPRHLNAEFEYVRVLDATGRWADIPYEGGAATVQRGAPVRLRIRAGNTGMGRWLARAGAGQVRAVLLDSAGGEAAHAPIARDVTRLGVSNEVEMVLAPIEGPTDLRVVMAALDRAAFGERRPITLSPQ